MKNDCEKPRWSLRLYCWHRRAVYPWGLSFIFGMIMLSLVAYYLQFFESTSNLVDWNKVSPGLYYMAIFGTAVFYPVLLPWVKNIWLRIAVLPMQMLVVGSMLEGYRHTNAILQPTYPPEWVDYAVMAFGVLVVIFVHFRPDPFPRPQRAPATQ